MRTGLRLGCNTEYHKYMRYLDPITLPSAISTSFFLAATMEVTSSGSEVPIKQ